MGYTTIFLKLFFKAFKDKANDQLIIKLIRGLRDTNLYTLSTILSKHLLTVASKHFSDINGEPGYGANELSLHCLVGTM